MFRHIALGGSARELSGFGRAMAYGARVISFLTVLVFFLDAINADVLYAAVSGDVRFQDNPLILDSSFDETSVAPNIGSSPNYFALVKYASGPTQLQGHFVPRFLGTTIIEDVDSPTVLDGADTSTLTYSFKRYFARTRIDGESAVTTVDRTISFSCLLI